MSSFYSESELKEIGFKKIGKNVLISKKASIYGANKISIGDNSRIDDFCIISGRVEIGKFVHIAAYTALYGGNIGIEIEDFCGISSRSALYAVSDDYSGKALTNPTIPEKYKSIIEKKIILKKHSLVGTNCTILPGVTLYEGVSVGANSLINKDCDEWKIYIGVPAKIFKERSKELLKLEEKFKNEFKID